MGEKLARDACWWFALTHLHPNYADLFDVSIAMQKEEKAGGGRIKQREMKPP